MHNLYILAMALGALLVAGVLFVFLVYISIEDSGTSPEVNRANRRKDYSA